MSLKFSKSTRLFGVVLALGAIVAVWGGMQVFAASSAAPASSPTLLGGVKAESVAQVPAGATLLKTWVNQNVVGFGTPMPGGFMSNIDNPVAIHCATKPHHTCLLVVNSSIQAGLSTPAGNRIAPLPKVDGSYMGAGPFIGIVPQGSYAGFSWQDSALITPGTHILQSDLYTDGPFDLANFEIEYALYTGN